jgi:hypothetical protein
MRVIKLVLREGTGTLSEVATFGVMVNGIFLDIGQSKETALEIRGAIGDWVKNDEADEVLLANDMEISTFIDMATARSIFEDAARKIGMVVGPYEKLRNEVKYNRVPGAFKIGRAQWFHRRAFEEWVTIYAGMAS